MRVVFLGNHNVGIEAIGAIKELAKIVGVVAHPDDPEDGVVYKSVFDYAINNNIPVIRSTGKSQQTYDFISNLNPDLIWVTDYRYIIPESLIRIAPKGAINLHPSLLPKYRGRASINWAIVNREKEVGLTAHYIDGGVDTGDIIEQIRIKIDNQTYIGDLLEKYYPIYKEITQKTLNKILSENGVITTKQNDSSLYPIYPKRTPEDGLIDWTKSIDDIYALIRAVSKPYPGAYTYFNDSKLIIWKAVLKFEIVSSLLINAGDIAEIDNKLFVKCVEGFLELTEFEII